MIGKKLTIAEKGGLQAHVEELGGDYSVFLEYRADKRISDTTLGVLLSKDKTHPIGGRTIARWRKYYVENELNA
jgi:hypothetical protein